MGRREITELHRETDARGARGVTLICAAARGLPLGAARDAGYGPIRRFRRDHQVSHQDRADAPI